MPLTFVRFNTTEWHRTLVMGRLNWRSVSSVPADVIVAKRTLHRVHRLLCRGQETDY